MGLLTRYFRRKLKEQILQFPRRLAAPIALFLIAACADNPKPIEPLKIPEKVKTEAKAPRRTPTPARRPSLAPAVESSYEVPLAATPKTKVSRLPTPPPELTKTPEPHHDPLILRAVDMSEHQNGAADDEGGWQLSDKGKIEQDNVKLEFTANKLVLDMKGIPALGIWPEVDLTMYNRTTKENFLPFNGDYVTTSSYREHRMNLSPSLPPGDYKVTFRFYNNSSPEESKDEVRKVSLRRIELLQ